VDAVGFRGRRDPHIERSRLDRPAVIAADERQIGRANGEGHDLGLTGRKRNLAERLELAHRASDACDLVVRVKLHHFLGGAAAAIGHGGGNLDRAAHWQARRAQPKIAIFDPAVGQPVAERIEGAVRNLPEMGLVLL
jgi:hypothetical protein